MPRKSIPEHRLRLSPAQFEVYTSPARFRVLVAGRRFGKTYLALAEILRAAQQKDRIVWYVGPTDDQSKRIAWDRLKDLSRPYWLLPPRESDLRIDFVGGSSVFVNGAFNPDSLRGTGLDLLVLDEFASMRPDAWTQVFRPALADRQGRALFIGTPQGRNHFYDRFEYAKTDPDWAAFQFTTLQGGRVEPGELIGAARDLDPESFRQEFEAEFTAVGRHRVYYPFDRAVHVQPLAFDPAYPIVWSIDFNVDPMCMLLMQRQGEMVYVFDEIVLRSSANTEAACQAFVDRVAPLYQRTPSHLRPLEVEIYGDSSGFQRRTSAADTDWVIVRRFFNGWNGTYRPSFRASSSNPAVRDRVNCVNARLRNHLGEARLFIDPRCKELIRDLEQVSWIPHSAEIDKSDPARTHSSDALGYFISQAFSLRPSVGPQPSRIL